MKLEIAKTFSRAAAAKFGKLAARAPETADRCFEMFEDRASRKRGLKRLDADIKAAERELQL